MPNRTQFNYDVNKAALHVLVPTLIPEDEYNVGLTPSGWNIGSEPWASRLSVIFAASERSMDSCTRKIFI